MSSTGARDTELPPFFKKLSVYVFIFNIISLLFHLFFINLTSSCSYSCDFMITTTLKCVNPRKKGVWQLRATSACGVFILSWEKRGGERG